MSFRLRGGQPFQKRKPQSSGKSCGKSIRYNSAMTNGMLTDEQQNQVQDIVRLIPAEEWAAFLDMLAHELRGRELNGGELRRAAERTWRIFLQYGWPMYSPGDVA